ncbi:hypothetical protein [Paenibacillus mendelii]|uniref:Uncharacterized protein n=1 Tax=Paenibacillus mendelii TaxID=206163 RepID=A0ABV6J6F0_9BACL|nr:hypothetical protein [Paenibacillus mendelii]MCQ6561184.1 hypothetical protein [Paenibacillus mendelii]
MTELGVRDRERAFLARWSEIRKKGRIRYTISRGGLYGLLLFGVWLAVTLIELNLSEFQQAIWTRDAFIRQCVIWFVCEMLIGGVLAHQGWKAKENKFKYLS